MPATAYYPPAPLSPSFLQRLGDWFSLRTALLVHGTIKLLLKWGVLRPWNQRVAKSWEAAKLSWDARAFSAMLNAGKRPIKSVEDTRAKTDGLAALLIPFRPDYSVSQGTTPAGVPIETVRANVVAQCTAPGAILWIHGGGYIGGRGHAWRGFAAEMSARMGGVEVVVPDYRRVPEADLREETIADCLDAYRYCVDKYGAEKLVIGGDSAGGGMTANLLLTISHDPSLPFPRAAVLLSPYIDLTFSYDTIDANGDIDGIILPDDARTVGGLCFAGRSYGPMDLPCMKPVAREGEWPSVLVMTGSHEVLAGDSRAFVKKLNGAGVKDVKYIEQDCMEHTYNCFFGWMSEADDALSYQCNWARAKLGI
ncbi:Alpha/Beta hydrolase protein [Hyaloraphidium curvatum]|nr:Alpha/Beta hydrolase protein [Hyaloraphidium curvatum]